MTKTAPGPKTAAATGKPTPPATPKPGLAEELQWRGLWFQATDPELGKLLDRSSISVYAGFDPTAASLHIGHLIPLLTLKRFQNFGHRAIAVSGGATGLIGDPSGKSDERKLLELEQIRSNVRSIERSMKAVLDPKHAVFLDNYDWFGKIGFIEFLRDTGKHFSVNAMMAKDSVRLRLEDRAQGISFTEFSYMLLQSYDFYHLYKEHGCTVQIGGSDQWGNITAGCELIRRKLALENDASMLPNVARHHLAVGLTFPLIKRSDGAKFGKTEAGAIWLDPKMTSPYDFYQYFVQVPDSDVIDYLKFFTFLSRDEITALESQTRTAPEARAAQKALARTVTTLVHGEAEVAKVETTSQTLFEKPVTELTAAELGTVFAKAPRTRLKKEVLAGGLSLTDLLVQTGVCASKGAARRDIEGGGIYLNDRRMQSAATIISADQLIHGHYLILRKGKKGHHVVEFDVTS